MILIACQTSTYNSFSTYNINLLFILCPSNDEYTTSINRTTHAYPISKKNQLIPILRRMSISSKSEEANSHQVLRLYSVSYDKVTTTTRLLLITSSQSHCKRNILYAVKVSCFHSKINYPQPKPIPHKDLHQPESILLLIMQSTVFL